MIFEALKELCPNCEYTVRDGVHIEWLSDPSLKPSDEEIQKKVDELTEKLPMKELRFRRDMLLSECDYKMVSDYKHKNKQAWIDYRQALRDLPEIIKEIKGNYLDYPTKPSD
jgi:hypothetical protein